MTQLNPPATEETLFRRVLALQATPVGQQTIPWIPKRWKAESLAVFGSQVEKLEHLCRREGERHFIARDDVVMHSQSVPELFISSMVFGHGDGGLGPTRVARISSPGGWDEVFEKLKAQFEQSVRGPSASWRSHTETSKVRYLGPSFATKFAYFSALKQGEKDDFPLIADLNTSWAIWWITRSVARSMELHDGYLAYVAQCRDWAEAFNRKANEGGPNGGAVIGADDVERALFDLGKQWRSAHPTK
jgi:hypothetical protein